MNMKYLFCSLLALASVSACAQPSGAPAPSSVSLAPVVVPALPQSLEFAGEAVPLDNYDTRESLLRELMSYDRLRINGVEYKNLPALDWMLTMTGCATCLRRTLWARSTAT